MTTTAPPPVPMNPRIRERRVAVQREAGRRRLRVLFGVAAALAVAGAAAGVVRSPLLDVDHVEVSGAPEDREAAVLRASGTADSPQLVDYDAAAAERRIERLPWVKAATVSRHWNGDVEIRVVLRRAVAAVPRPEGWAQVDRAGRVIALSADPAGLITVAAPPARLRAGDVADAARRTAIAVAAALGAERHAGLRAAVNAVVPDIERQPAAVALQLGGGGLIQLGGTADLEEKLIAASTMLATVDPASIDVLDVRVPTAPVLRRKAVPSASARARAKPAPVKAATTSTTMVDP